MRTKSITKEKIIFAAARVLSEQGLENTTVDTIAREAGVAKGSIYVHFQSRDDLLIQCGEYLVLQRIETLSEGLSKITSAAKKLELLLKANQRMIESDSQSFFMHYSLLLSTHRDIRHKIAAEYFSKYIDFVEKIIYEGVISNEFKIENIRLTAFMLIMTQDLGILLNKIDSKVIDSRNLAKELLFLMTNYQ